jgi:hypothetical protein
MGEGKGEGEQELNNYLKDFARSLRKGSTNAENILWRQLRAKRLLGLKFRRQEPIGRYIVDFVCHEKKVIIELDGGQPLPSEAVSYCHCERAKRPKQSHNVLKKKEIAALPGVARNDRNDYDTVSQRRGNKNQNLMVQEEMPQVIRE